MSSRIGSDEAGAGARIRPDGELRLRAAEVYKCRVNEPFIGYTRLRDLRRMSIV